MSISYTREVLLRKCNEAIKDVETFYTKGFVNYQGKVKGEDTLYTEVVLEFILDNINSFKEIEPISRKKRRKPYNMYHTGEHNPNSIRNEEIIAMEMFNQSKKGHRMNRIGEIIDYQTPLKSSMSDKAGKIDLLSDSDEAVYILELKKKSSKETMLRCVLEAYTYLRLVDKEQLLGDFGIESTKSVYAAPLVFWKGSQWDEMQETWKHPKLIELMRELEIKGPFYVKTDALYDVVAGDTTLR